MERVAVGHHPALGAPDAGGGTALVAWGGEHHHRRPGLQRPRTGRGVCPQGRARGRPAADGRGCVWTCSPTRAWHERAAAGDRRAWAAAGPGAPGAPDRLAARARALVARSTPNTGGHQGDGGVGLGWASRCGPSAGCSHVTPRAAWRHAPPARPAPRIRHARWCRHASTAGPLKRPLRQVGRLAASKRHGSGRPWRLSVRPPGCSAATRWQRCWPIPRLLMGKSPSKRPRGTPHPPRRVRMRGPLSGIRYGAPAALQHPLTPRPCRTPKIGALALGTSGR